MSGKWKFQDNRTGRHGRAGRSAKSWIARDLIIAIRQHACVFFCFAGLIGLPGCQLLPNLPPHADDQSVSVPINTPKAITLTAGDPDNGPQALTYSIVSPPQHGTLTGTPPNVTYAPNTGYSGPDSFTFKANDGAADSNTATVSITVQAGTGLAAGSRFTKYRGTYQLSWRDEALGAVRTCDVSGTLEFENPVRNTTDFVPGTTYTYNAANSTVAVANYHSVFGAVCDQAGPGHDQFFHMGELIFRNSPDEYALVLRLTLLTDGTCSPGGPYKSIGTVPSVGWPHQAACAGPKFVAVGSDAGHLAGSASWTGCGDLPPYDSFTATLTWDLTGVE